MSPLTDRPKSASLFLGRHECRTPAPLNAVGEEMLVKARGLDTGGRFAFFHLMASAMSGRRARAHPRGRVVLRARRQTCL